MTSFDSTKLDSLIDETFNESINPLGAYGGAISIKPDTQLQEDRRRKESADAARSLGMVGGFEQLDEMVEDPEFSFRESDYQKNLDEYQREQKVGQYAATEEEIQTRIREGAGTEEIADLQSKLYDTSLLTSPELVMPKQQVTRRELRERHGVATPKERKPLSDAEYLRVTREMLEARRNPLTGSMATPQSRRFFGLSEFRPEAAPDRGIFETAGLALTQGFYDIANSAGIVGIAGASIEGVFGKSALSRGLQNFSATVAAQVELAKSQTNFDERTGFDYGPLPDSVWVDALKSVPPFAVDIALTMVGVGLLTGAKKGATAASLMANGVAARQANNLAAKALAKRRARAFAGYAGFQSASHQYNESYNEYVVNRGMDPAEAVGTILTETVAAGVSTAITSRIEGGFLFTTKGQAYMARSMAVNGLANFMAGYASEGFQETAEQILTDVAIASLAKFRGDEERLKQTGLLEADTYLYKLYRTFAAAGLVGGGAGVVTRSAFSPEVTSDTDEQGRLYSDEEREAYRRMAEDGEYSRDQVLSGLMEIASAKHLATETDRFKQRMVVEDRADEFAEVPVPSLLNVILDEFSQGSHLYIGEGDQRVRVTPEMAIHALKQRGIKTNAIPETHMADYLTGNTRLGQTKTAKKKQAKAERLTKEQRANNTNLWQKALARDDSTIADVDALIDAVPDQAIAFLENSSDNPSRGEMRPMLQASGVEPNSINSSTTTRKRLKNLIGLRLDRVRQSRDVASARQQEAEVTEARAAVEGEDASRTRIAMRSGERELIDSALDEINTEENTDLLMDVSLTDRDIAERLPSVFPFESRLQRVRDLRNRQNKGQATLPARDRTKAQKEAKAQIVEQIQARENKEKALAQETRAKRDRQKAADAKKAEKVQERRSQEESATREDFEARVRTEQDAVERADVRADEEAESQTEREEEAYVRDVPEAANATVAHIMAMYGQEEGMRLLQALRSGGADIPLDVMSQLFEVQGAIPGIATIPVSDSEFQNALNVWRTAFDMFRRGEGDLFGVQPQGWAAPEPTQTFPTQSWDNVQLGVQTLTNNLKRDLPPDVAENTTVFFDDGNTTLTDRQKQLSELGKKFGITVVFFRGAPANFRGYHSGTPGVVAINASYSENRAAYEIFWHEATHDLEKRSPGAWNRMLRNMIGGDPTIRAAIARKLKEYNSAYRAVHADNPRAQLSDERIMSETPALAAEMVADLLMDNPNMATQVAETSQVEAASMSNSVLGMIKRLGLKITNQRSREKAADKIQINARAGTLLGSKQKKVLANILLAEFEVLKSEKETGKPSGVGAIELSRVEPVTRQEFMQRMNELEGPTQADQPIQTPEGRFSLSLQYSFEELDSDRPRDVNVTTRQNEEDKTVISIGGPVEGDVVKPLRVVVRNEDLGIVATVKAESTQLPNLGAVWKVRESDSQIFARNQGVGTRMYKMLIDEGLRTGVPVVSDSIVSKSAARVYRSLAKRGYKVSVNPAARYDPMEMQFGINTDSEWEFVNDRWIRADEMLSIFAVTSGPINEPLRQSAEGDALAEALADFEFLGKFSVALSPDIPKAEFRDATVTDLVAAHKKNPRSQFLSEIDVASLEEQVKNKTAHPVLSSDGNSGYLLVQNDPNNPELGFDIQGVFSSGAVKGAGKSALVDAIARGGRTLDAFDGYLPRLYGAFGFKETHRAAFNDEYAPVNWDFEKYGRPDVVLMTYTGVGTNATEIANEYAPTREEPAGTNYITDDWPSAERRLEGLLQSPVLGGYAKSRTGVESSRSVQGLLSPEPLAESTGRFSLTPESHKAIKKLQKRKIDLPKLFAGKPLEPENFKTVKPQLLAVMSDMVKGGVNTPEHFALLAKDAFGLTNTAANAFKKDITARLTKTVKESVKGGLPPYLLVKPSTAITAASPLVSDADTIDGRKKALQNIDLLLQRHPNAFGSVKNSNAFMADLFRAAQVPIAPHNLIKLVKNDDLHAKLLSQASERQLNGRRHGMALGRNMRKLYASGKMEPKHTAMLMTWGILSRQLSPFPQETAALQAFTSPVFEETIDAVLSGKAASWTNKEWTAKSQAITDGLIKPARGATGNMNSAFNTLLAKLSQQAPDGRTYLEHAHEIFASNDTGKEMRRKLMSELPSGIGIDIKVLSFLLLVSGKTDVLIMDRVQIENMYDDGRFNGINIYGGGLVNIYGGLPSLAIYEALEAQLAPVIENVYEKAGIGRSEASLGAWHWDTWNLRSGQAASHGSLQYLVADAEGQLDSIAPERLASSEGRYGATDFGLQFIPTTTQESAPRLLYEIDNNTYEFTPALWQEVSRQRSSVLKPSSELARTDQNGKRFQNGNSINEDFILDDGQNPLTDAEGNLVAWYNDSKILLPGGKQSWIDIVEQHGIRANSDAIDANVAANDAGALTGATQSSKGRFSIVNDGMSRDATTADREQFSMIERLSELERKWTNKLPSDYDQADDVFVGDERSKGSGRVGIFKKVLSPLHYAVLGTSEGHPVRDAVRRIIAIAMDQEVISGKQSRADTQAYNQMPDEWKKNKGYRFAQLMDQWVPLENDNTALKAGTRVTYLSKPGDTTPFSVEVQSLPEPVRNALLHFKQRSEEQRTEIVSDKRDFLRGVFGRATFADLRNQALAEEEGSPALYSELEIDTVDGVKVFVSSDRYITREELAEELVMHQVPSDWGMQYAHFHHAFFGKFKLKAYRDDGSSVIIGDANSQREAYEKLVEFKEGPRGSDFTKFEAMPERRFDADMTRLSNAQRSKLAKELASAAEMTSSEVNNAMRGIVGLKRNKKPFFAPLMQRGEVAAEGFSMDFPRVWSMQNNNFNRWKFGGIMTRETQPVIEKLRSSEPYWATYLEEHLDRTLFIRPTEAEQMIDGLLQSIPVLGNMVGDLPTRRTLAAVRTFNFLRQLKTPRQWMVNSIQPLQTVYPIIGGKTFREATVLYNSAEGKELLRKHGRMDPSAGMYIDGTETSMGQRAIETVTKGQELIDKYLLRGKISSQSEVRNMNFSFVAFYLHGRKLGMSEAEAADYGRREGYVGSQFAYTRANLPPILNGPIASSLLQYRRFQMNMVGFGLGLLKEKNYPGAARWLLVNTIAGGMKGVLFTFLPGYFLMHSACEWLGLCDETTDRNNMLYKTRKALKNTVGEESANALVFGLPAFLGADLSGSLSLWSEPYGKTTGERLFNQYTGPSVGLIKDLYEALSADTVTPTSTTTRLYRSLKDTGPAFKWLARNAEYLAGYEDEYDDRGRLRYRNSDKGRGLWTQLATGARTVNESVWALEFDRLQILREANDAAMTKAATLWSGRQYSKAVDVINQHNAAYPHMRFGVSDLEARIKNAKTAATVPQAERRAQIDASKRVRKQFNWEQGG